MRFEIGIDANDPEALAEFWCAVVGYSVGEFDPAGVYLDLVPPTDDLPVLYLQRVDEPKRAKNRVHLDLWVSDPEALIDLAVTLGAERVGPPRTGSAGGWWQVLVDPEGNEFCICRAA
jgi:predicted enzyme related to lactoylglutathione lyase